MKKFNSLRAELYEATCPVATMDLHENVKNRQHAIDEYLYGPANPNEPGDHWNKIAKVWGISVENAKTMTCGNCAAFDISDKMRKCIEVGMQGKLFVDGTANNVGSTSRHRPFDVPKSLVWFKTVSKDRGIWFLGQRGDLLKLNPKFNTKLFDIINVNLNVHLTLVKNMSSNFSNTLQLPVWIYIVSVII